jgi:hypothetical protein
MHHAAAPLEPSRQRHLHRGRSLNQSDQSKIRIFLAEAAGEERARGGSGETGERIGSAVSMPTTSTSPFASAETGKKRRAGVNQSDQSKTRMFMAEAAGEEKARGESR